MSSKIFGKTGFGRVAGGGVALVLFAGLAACASEPGDTPGADAPGGEEQVITIWHYSALDAQLENMDVKETAFIAEHPGVRFERLYIPYNDLPNRLIAAAQTNTGPDLIFGDGANAFAFQEAGAIQPIQACVDTWSTKDDIASAAFREVDGTNYAVRLYSNLIALWYNQDLLDQLGLQPPKTVKDMEAAMVSAKDAGFSGLVFDGMPDFPGAWQSRPMMTAMGVDYPNVDAESTTAALARIQSWVDNGYSPRDVISYTQDDVFNEFLAGNYLFAVDGNWEIEHAKRDATFAYGVVPFPDDIAKSSVYVSGESGMLGAFGAAPELTCQYLGEQWFSKQGSLDSLDLVGSLPILESLATDPKIADDPLYAPFAEVAAGGISTPGGREFQLLNTLWGPAFSEVLAGGDPAVIGPRLVEQVNSELAK